MADFKSFGKIENIGRLWMSITQKIHGTNAQIYIYPTENGLELKAGSRTRWLTAEDDNFGFANYVYSKKDEIINILGEGRHFGEWAGPGINSGEGLKEKIFCLFNWKRWARKPLPAQMITVPVLYTGAYDHLKIQEIMEDLKNNGSKLSQGFMKPEGIVVQIGDNLYKKVFEQEDSPWQEPKERKIYEKKDVSHLLQPIRLEKLLSRDEKYLRNYPASLRDICSDYFQDLKDEGYISGDEDEVNAIKKSLGSQLFSFVKEKIGDQYATK